MIRKIFVLGKFIFFAKFIFHKPQAKQVIIFDCAGDIYLELILSDFDYMVLSTRVDAVKKIFLTKKIIVFMLSNFFKRSMKQNYLIILIKEINPKVVITHIDNSIDFHIISKFFYKKIKFIAIQRANRDTKWMPLDQAKKIFIPEYFCFSNYDKYIYSIRKTNVKNFHIIGSLRASLSLEYVKSKKIKINKNQYDVCLIGEPQYSMNGVGHIKKLPYSVGTHAEYAYRFCKKYNLKLVFAGAEVKNTEEFEKAKNFYKKYLVNYKFKYNPVEPHKYSSYILVMKSKVVVGNTSTLLRESLTFDKKVLCCNFTGQTKDIGELPIKKEFILRKDSYELFEKKMLKILSMSNKKYFKYLGRNKNYLMPPSNDSINFVQNKIRSYLN